MSLSARRAWIEISPKLEIGLSSSVALRKENVDRNSRTAASTFSKTVALRKESVDRNTRPPNRQQQRPVALRKESVDRNLVIHIRVCAGHNVALRKE